MYFFYDRTSWSELQRQYMPIINAAPLENSFYTSQLHYTLSEDVIFVFGSNTAGRHGKGAALTAHRLYGAKYGKGEGRERQSYAIPTKDEKIITLPLSLIELYVEAFIDYTYKVNHSFFVTAVGTGLAGYRHDQIAPLFKGTRRCWFPDTWIPYLPSLKEYASRPDL